MPQVLVETPLRPPAETAERELRRLADALGSRYNLPVLEGGRLVGLLRREDVLNWLSLYEGTVEA